MPKKLNIRELLKGSVYEDKAEILALKIEGWGLDNDRDIYSVPAHGKVAGINPNLIIEVIVNQSLKEPGEVAAFVEEVSPRASLAAAELAEEYEINLSAVNGSGKDGIIVKSDVEKLIVIEEDKHDD